MTIYLISAALLIGYMAGFAYRDMRVNPPKKDYFAIAVIYPVAIILTIILYFFTK